MSKLLSKISLLTIIVSATPNFDVKAQEQILTKEHIENTIAKDKDLENVILILPNNFVGYHIMAFHYDELPKKVVLTLRDKMEKVHLIKISYDEATMVCVPKSTIIKGRVIENSDLVQAKFPRNSKNSNLIISCEEIIGKAARKNLISNKPISLNDTSNPNIILKGQTIKILYNKGKLNIETKGIAVQGGSIGEFIEVKSIDSNRTITGKITSSNAVTIEAR